MDINELYAIIYSLRIPDGMDCSEVAQEVLEITGGEIYTIASAINPVFNPIRVPDDVQPYVYHVVVLTMINGMEYVVDGSVRKIYPKEEYMMKIQMLNPGKQLNYMPGDCSAYFI